MAPTWAYSQTVWHHSDLRFEMREAKFQTMIFNFELSAMLLLTVYSDRIQKVRGSGALKRPVQSSVYQLQLLLYILTAFTLLSQIT